ncbi:S8 family serine peptidase [Saccharibacillus sacchari]|uniref:S8 family serine peptidase n=1 Tax=Saccharibacillus sacchari TaxID=456493 RepID=A0ACC6PHU7_9BACL
MVKKVSHLSFAVVLTLGTALPYGASAAGAGASSVRYSGLELSGTLDSAIISSDVDTHSSGQERIIVQFSRDPLASSIAASGIGARSLTARTAERAIDTQQDSFVARAEKLGIDLTVNYTYDTVLNGMEITVAANDIPKLASIEGVTSIDANQTYYEIPVEESAQDIGESKSNFELSPLKQMGVDEAWAEGFTGAGLKVGVIDTGVDYLHPDLKDAYKGGYDSFEKDDDPYEEPPIEIDGTSYAGTSHGTHVSGTIVGRATNPTSDLVQKGVAYEADLYVYKVLGRNIKTGRASGSSAQVIDGIEHAVKDGMDVINLSLGSDSNKDPNSPDAIAINNAVLSGVTAILANGNAADSGPYYYSMGSPATSQLGISVGAVTSESKRYQATLGVTVGEKPAEEEPAADPGTGSENSDHNGGTVEAPEGESAPTVTSVVYDVYHEYPSAEVGVFAWKIGQENFAEQFGTAPNDAVYANLGADADYEALAAQGIDVKDKVVFVSRGSLTFDAKVQGAAAHGAKGIVIFNGNVDPNNTSQANLAESISGRDEPVGSVAFLGDSFSYVPYFDYSGTQGRAIARQLLAQGSPEFKISFGSEYPKSVVAGDKMAAFSSRGPNGDDKLSIKPDVVAPGVNLLSTYPEYGKFEEGASYDEAYARSSGTSMATPHIAGLALLLLQQHPDWTPFDVRAALANTADTISDEEGTRYDVYSQGAGRADVANALDTPALLQALENITILNTDLTNREVVNYSPSTSFGVVSADSGPIAQTLQLKNVSQQNLSYTASVAWNTSVTSDPEAPIATPDSSKIAVRLTGLNGGMVEALAGSETPFELEIDPSADAAVGVYEGQVLLQSAGQPDLHLPFVVHIGDEKPVTGFGVENVQVERRIVQPHVEAEASTDVTFTLTADDAKYIQIAAVGYDDESVGLLDEIANEDSQGNLLPIKPGTYTFEDVSDLYFNEKNKEFKLLPNDNYQLEISAFPLNADGSVIRGSDGEIVKYTAYSSFRIQNGEGTKLASAEAKIDRTGVVTNTTNIGLPVLTLPTDTEADYQVAKSDNPALIGADGILKSLPVSGKTVVDLTVHVVSKAYPEDYNEVVIPVVLNASPSSGNNGGSTGGGSTGGGAAVSTPVVTAPTVPTTTAPPATATVGAVVPAGQQRIALTPVVATSGNGGVAASFTDAALTEALKSAGATPTSLVLSVPTQAGQAAQVTITSAQLAQLTSAQTTVTLVVSSGSGAVALPASIFKQVPAGSSLQLNVTPSAEAQTKFAAYLPGASVIGTPVAFELAALDAAGQATPITSTGSVFVARSFAVEVNLPSGGAGVVYEENGKLRPVASKFAAQTDGTTLVTVSRPGFSTYAVVSAPSSFADIRNSWAKTAIEQLSSKLLVNGTSASAFAPKRDITRAEFAALLVRSLGLSNQSAAPFDDVSANDWFAGDVAAAYEAGLINGTGNGKFDPNAVITREQLAVLLTHTAELLNLKEAGGAPVYADSSSFASYAAADIQSASAYGLIQGTVRGAQSYFDPKAPATREAAALVLQKLLVQAGLIE